MLERHFISPRQNGKTYSAVDFAATTGHNLMLGTSNPKVWAIYLKNKYPTCPFKIVENGIVINPRE